MFDEIRMAKKPDGQADFQDIMTFKFGQYWSPYPFSINLNNSSLVLFPKIKGPNDPTNSLNWDQDWTGEIWTADTTIPETDASLIYTFDKNTEAVIIPKDKIYNKTQLIVRIRGTMPNGADILYDQFFITLSTETGEVGGTGTGGEVLPGDGGEVGGGGGEPTIVIQIPCYVTTLSPANTVLENVGGVIDLSITTSLESCAWTPSTSSDWLIVPEDEFVGNRTVQISVLENETNEVRVGTVVVGGYEFTVIQKGVPVEIEIPDYGYSTTINPANIIIGTEPYSGSFDVVVGKSDAQWNIEVDDFIVLDGPSTRTGNSTVSFRVLENTDQESRLGKISAAGGNFHIYQRGVQAPIVEESEFITQFTPEYVLHTRNASSGSDSFSVKTNVEGVQWNATVNHIGSSQPWVTITNGQGNGNGVVTYTVLENKTYSPRFAEIKVTTSEGHYRVFPIAQEAAPMPFVAEWGRRFIGPTIDDFSVNVTPWTWVGDQGQEVKIAVKVGAAENKPWKLWVSPPITPGSPVSGNELVAEGVGNSWDNVSYEDAIVVNIPNNPELPLLGSNPRVFRLFLTFIEPDGTETPTKNNYLIVQKAKPTTITETVTVIEQVEIPSKFIKNVIPPFTIAQGIGGIFEMDVETSVEDCAWQASSDVDWVDLIANIVPGGALPEGERAVKLIGFNGNNKLKFQVSENNTSDVRIMVIPFKVFPNGFSGSPPGYQYGIFPEGFVDASEGFVNGYHTVIQVPKPGGIRLIIDGKVDVIPTSTIPFNVNVTYQNSQSTPNP
jgi:hypothetical protein